MPGEAEPKPERRPGRSGGENCQQIRADRGIQQRFGTEPCGPPKRDRDDGPLYG